MSVCCKLPSNSFLSHFLHFILTCNQNKNAKRHLQQEDPSLPVFWNEGGDPLIGSPVATPLEPITPAPMAPTRLNIVITPLPTTNQPTLSPGEFIQ